MLEALEPRPLLALAAQFATVAAGSPVIPSTFTDVSVADTAVASAVDAAGNTYLAGTYTNTMSFPGVGLITGDSFGSYSYVAKFNSSGQTVWVHNIFDLLNLRLALDPSGNLYVSGNTPVAGVAVLDPAGHSGLSGFGSSYAPVPANNIGNIMLEVIKFASDGSLAWGTANPARIFSGVKAQPTASLYAGSITTDSAGAVYLSAYANDTGNEAGVGEGFINGSQGIYQYSDPNFNSAQQIIGSQPGDQDNKAYYFFATKLDPSGTNDWAAAIPSSYSFSTANNSARIAVDTKNHVFVTDTDDDSNSGNPTTTLTVLNSNTGGVNFEDTAVTGPQITANEVAVDGNGNFTIAGSFSGTALFQGDELTSISSRDIYIEQYNITTSSGNESLNYGFHQQFGTGSNTSNVTALVSDGTRGVYLAGSFQGTLPLGSQTLTSQGSSDLFLTLISPQGAASQAQDIGGASGYTYSDPALAMNNSGLISVAAIYQGSGGSPTFSGAPLPAGGGVIAAQLSLRPAVTVSSPSVVSTSTSFVVSWSATSPIGAAITSYNVLVSDSGGSFTTLLASTQQTQYTFMGVDGHTYGFKVTATDASGLASTTPAAPQAVTLIDILSPTSTALSSSANPSTYGQSVTFTALVTSTAGGRPTGKVTFTIDGTAQAPVTLAVTGGQDIATFTTLTLTVGNHTVSASYSGDDSFATSVVTTALTQTVNPATPTVNLTAPSGPYTGAPFTATATITGVSGGAPDDNPITYTYSGTVAGAAYGPTSDAPSLDGDYSVTAQVAAGGNYNAATSAAVAFTIGPRASQVTVVDNGGTYNGGPFPATVVVAGVAGGPPNNNPYTTTYAGTASTGAVYGPSATAPKEAGTYTVTVSVEAGPDYRAATVTSPVFTIGPATPTITLEGDGSSSQVMAKVTGISGGAPDTNAVSYTYTGITIANANYGPTSVAPTETGSYSVTASVAAGGNYVAATSAPLAFSLGKTSPGLNVDNAGGIYNGSSFPATVSVTGTDGVARPALEGVAPTLAYFAGPTATGIPLAGPPTATGTYFVLASFAGSGHYTPTSTGTSFFIGQAMPTLNLTPSSGTYNGMPFAAGATIAGLGGLAGSSLENVAPILTYYAGPSPTGNALAGAPSAAGNYTVVASFAGSTNFRPAQVSAMFSIAKATPVVSWASPADITSDTALGAAQLNAQASVAGGFTYTPSAGTVLPAGAAQLLKVTFTPADPVDYAPVTGSTTINVVPPTLPPSPPHMTQIRAVKSKKGLTSVTVSFDVPLDSSSASSPALYRVAGGVTKVVKRHRQTAFTKPLAIKNVTLNGGGTSVTLNLAKPYKGVVQVTAAAGLTSATGAASTSASSLTVS